MMGLFGQSTVKKPRSSVDDKIPEDTEPDDTSILSVFHLFSFRVPNFLRNVLARC
jgi:hypothetical protein